MTRKKETYKKKKKKKKKKTKKKMIKMKKKTNKKTNKKTYVSLRHVATSPSRKSAEDQAKQAQNKLHDNHEVEQNKLKRALQEL